MEALMAFDGLLIHHLCDELKTLLVGGRIDKIYQPEKDELILSIRGLKSNFSLFISIDASMPYFTLIKDKKENPQAPPMFCMLMRKHLIGGRIHSIEQMGFERTVVLDIESKNDFGEFEMKKLVVEIMGKHSNIVLTREDYAIIDSIKRVTPEMSRIRTILPGLGFTFIPTDKIDFSLPNSEIIDALKARAGMQKLHKGLYESIQGFSPVISRWICQSLNLEQGSLISDLVSEDYARLSKLFDKIKSPYSALESEKGYVYFDAENVAKMVYFMPDMVPVMTCQAYPSLSEAVDRFYVRTNKENKMHQRTNHLKKTLAQRVERYTTKLAKQELERIEAENADASRIIGDLIIANNYLITKGMNRIEVLDYYAEPPVMRTIELDTRLEPIENAQVHFKKYNKLKKALLELNQHIEETKVDVDYLESVLTHLNNSEDSKIVEEIRDELVSQGYIKGKITKKGHKVAKQTFKTYIATDGLEILVGKSSLQNDHLTTKLASNKDIWLHTKDIPGSHVIIRTVGESPSEQTLYEAAMIAAYYSKAKNSSNVPVDYTLVKNVSKPSGSKPGMVIYVGNKTLFVTPDYDVIKKLEKH
jgi:predicted ribosome quality control (RQC) complex YloA/Tae2 family protein